MVPIGAANVLPVLHLGRACLRQDLGRLDLDIVCMGCLNRRQVLPRLSQCLLGLSQTTEDNQRVALGELMAEVKQIRNAQTIQASFSQLDQRLSPVAYQIRHLRSEEHTSELQSPCNLVCRLLLEKKKKNIIRVPSSQKKKKNTLTTT